MKQSQNKSLQKYLDHQIEIFSKEEKPTFDHIETKLKQIENKLHGLKNYTHQNRQTKTSQQQSTNKIEKKIEQHSQYNSQKKYSEAQQTSKVSLKNQQISPIKKEYFEHQSKEIVKTPKHLDIVSKTMSAAHIGYDSKSVKKYKKNYTNQKEINFQSPKTKGTSKKQIRTQQNKFLSSNKKYKSGTNLTFTQQNHKYSNTPKKITARSLVGKEAERQVKVLKKQVERQQKTNAQLRRRMNELRSYEQQCCKLKQIFDRCQQLRRRTRLRYHM